MAKCHGPLFSESASGKLKSHLTFSQRSSGQQVRFQKPSPDLLTDARSASRNAYKDAADSWSLLSTGQKAVYIARAVGKPYSGYNLFMSENIAGVTCGIYGVKIYATGLYGSII